VKLLFQNVLTSTPGTFLLRHVIYPTALLQSSRISQFSDSIGNRLPVCQNATDIQRVSGTIDSATLGLFDMSKDQQLDEIKIG